MAHQSLASGRASAWHSPSKRIYISIILILCLPCLYFTLFHHIRAYHTIPVDSGLIPPTTDDKKEPESAHTNTLPTADDSSSSASSLPVLNHRHKHLRLLVHAASKHIGLCRTLYSAAALGYPAPSLVNWGRHARRQKGVQNETTSSGYIGGVLEELVSLSSDNDDDLVLIVDEPDTWLQLRPETLISRYFDIIKQADERLQSNADTGQGLVHEVVFSAQKHCWPSDPNSLACVSVPNSTLPIDVYGNATDFINRNGGDDKYEHFRPRWLNSGSVMGTVAAVRAVFAQAHEANAVNPGMVHHQGHFVDILSQQEILRRRAHIHRGPANDTTELKTSEAFHPVPGQKYEFGITLDYEMALVMPSMHSWHEIEWVRFKDNKKLRKHFKHYGIPQSQYQRALLPPDITRTGPPSSINSGNMTKPEMKKDIAAKPEIPSAWKRASLLTNMRTGIIPVAIHHNAKDHHLESQIMTRWNQTWFQPHLRTLLEAHSRRLPSPIAALDTHGDGLVQEWWSDSHDLEGVHTQPNGGGEYLGYDQLCSAYDGDLLRKI